MSELETTESDLPDPFGIPDPIVGSDDEKIRRSVEELNKQREERGTGFPRDTIIERTWHLSGPTTLKDATAKISDEHKIEVAQDYMRSIGVEADDAFAKQVGDMAARLGRQPSELPHSKVSVVNDHGEAVPELRDDEPITLQNSFDSPADARRSMRNYRDAQAATAQALLDELGARQESAAEPSPAPPPPSPEPPKPQQPDVAARREAAAVQAHQVANSIAQMTQAEAALWTDISRHEAEVFRAYPEASSHEAFEESRKSNPARIEALLHEKQRSDAAKAQLQALSTNRQHAQQQIASRQREQMFDRADAEFNNWLQKAHPTYAKGARRNELTQAVKSYLREDLGLSDKEVAFHYKESGILRSPAAQKLLTNSAMFKMAQEKARNVAAKRVLPPASQRPGVYRPSNSGALEDVASLQRQLDGATGQNALKLATKLTQARRAAGL